MSAALPRFVLFAWTGLCAPTLSAAESLFPDSD